MYVFFVPVKSNVGPENFFISKENRASCHFEAYTCTFQLMNAIFCKTCNPLSCPRGRGH